MAEPIDPNAATEPVPEGSAATTGGAAQADAAAVPRRRGRRWPHALGLLSYAALALGLPVLAAWALLFHPRALPLLLPLVPGVQASGIEGTLGGGRIRIAQLVLTLPANRGRLQIDQFALDGLAVQRTPHAGAWLALRWRALDAEHVRFTSGPPSGKAPTSLQLPLVLEALPLRLGQLQIDTLAPLLNVQARVSVGVDNGRQHRLDDLHLQVAGVQLQGHATIGSKAPLPLVAELAANAPQAKPPWHAKLSARGPLARLELQADLQGDKLRDQPAPSLQAQATLAPFERWPLAALTLSTLALDLRALVPQWPQTLLDGHASVQTSGLIGPLSVQASVVNRQPGAIDSGRVPLRRLTVAVHGDLQHTDRANFDHLELLLGDAQASAGRASGSGQWQGDTLQLQLLLDDLQPARLHGGAAALSISGPLALQASGIPLPTAVAGTTAKAAARAAPQVAVQATLSGRALDGAGQAVKLRLDAIASAQHIVLREAQASAGAAQASLTLDAQAQPGGWHLRGDARLARFDPLPWWRGSIGTAWRRGPHLLDGTLRADVLWHGLPSQGLLLDQLLQAADGDATLHLSDSLLAGVPFDADWTLRSSGRSVSLATRSNIGGNQWRVDGQRGTVPTDDRWQVDLQMPNVAPLLPLRTLAAELVPDTAAELNAWWPTEGEASGKLEIQGRWPALQTQGSLTLARLKAPSLTLHQAQAQWRTHDQADAPLSLQINMAGLHVAGQQIDQMQAEVTGKLRQHALTFTLDSPLRPPAWADNVLGAPGQGTRVAGRAQGAWNPEATGGGTWRLRELHLEGGARDAQGGSRSWLAANGLAAELRVNREGEPQTLALAPGRIALLSTALRWREAQWQAGSGQVSSRLTLLGELETIDVAKLLARTQPAAGWGGDLTVGGHVELRSAEQLDVDVVLERLGGDLTLGDDLGQQQGLGLTDLRLALGAHNGLWQFAQGLAGRSLGVMAGAQVLRTGADRRWPGADSTLSGVLEASVSNLGIWGTWIPPGWRLGGQLQTSASLAGTLREPELRGSLQGSQLSIRNVLQGVNLSDGKLGISLAGDRATVDTLVFNGGDGTLQVHGGATLGSAPQLNLSLAAEHFRLLGRIDRRVVGGGQATLQMDAQQLRLDGQLTVDEGLIDISRADAPKLDSDVVVNRPEAEAPDRAATSVAPLPAPLRNAKVSVNLNLGQKLRLRGRGVDTLLRGDLVVSSSAGHLALNGNVRGDGGSYAAYGQKLDITRGDLVFSGALDNPRLDVQATRPNLDMTVGVSITGPALNPRIRLFSEPELAEYDKLSWLVLGRSPDGLGRTDTALLQRAAMALLAGDGKTPTDDLINALGLTDFSLRQTEGTVRETIVSLGRQLSRRWYVGYERSVNATSGTWQLVYRVAQRFTLRAQSGSENALDAIWSWRW